MNSSKVISLFLTFCILLFTNMLHAQQETLHIAVVSPYDEDPAGIKGLQLYLNQVHNQTSNGIKISIDRYVDNNKKDQAVSVAQQIAEQGRAVAVVGHNYSSTSSAAGKIYKEAGIPAISYSATNPKVTENNPWYFRTTFNDAIQGDFLAYYTLNNLKYDHITIIYEPDNYGTFLAETFEEKALEYGAKKIKRFKLDMSLSDEQRYQTLKESITRDKEQAGLIFMATHSREGIKLVKLLKDEGVDNPVMGVDSFNSTSFMNGFNQEAKEQNNPGYYTNGIYLSAPIVFDVANAAAQDMQQLYHSVYGDKPDWAAAYGYDTAKVIMTAITNSQANSTLQSPPNIEQRRLVLRQALESINSPANAIPGVTGLNYFDAQGDAVKPVFIAVLHDRSAVSGMEQYSDIPDINKVVALEQQLTTGQIVAMGDRFMYKKTVIFTGVKLHHINHVNDQKNTSELDFTLWFRYRGQFDPNQIEFDNSLGEITLGDPYIKTQANNIHYQAFRIKGVFRNNFIDDIERRDQVSVGFSLRNKELDRNSLLYATDIMGLGLTGDNELTDEVKDQLITDDLDGWQINNARIFERSIDIDSLGIPQYINITDASVPYSQFHYVIDLKQTGISLGDMLPARYAEFLSLLSLALFIVAYLSRHILPKLFRKKIQLARVRWLLLCLSSALLLTASEVWLSHSLFPTLDSHLQKWILHSYDLLWWIIPAILLVRAVEAFIWQALQHKTGRPVPGVIKGLIAFVIYTLAMFAIVAFVYNQKLTGLLATSGLLAMIIGLAIQMNLSNIFSGIALNLEHPFRVGDWVKIGDHEGQVIDVNWRATRLLTRVKHEISIPNTPAADSPIINYSNHEGVTRQVLMIGVHPIHEIKQVKALLISAAYKHPNVLHDPPPRCPFAGVNDGVAQYRLIFSYTDYALTFQVVDQIWGQIIENFQEAGINYLPPMQRVELHKAFVQPTKDTNEDINFQQTQLFSGLPDEFCQALEELMVEKDFKAGQYLVEKGQKNHSLYILRSGVVAVMKENEAGQLLEQQRLGLNDLINAETLYGKSPTQESVQAVVDVKTWEITKPVLRALFEQQPDCYAPFNRQVKELAQQIEQRKVNSTLLDNRKMKDRFAWMES